LEFEEKTNEKFKKLEYFNPEKHELDMKAKDYQAVHKSKKYMSLLRI
jgi:hypothetical protein